MYFDGFKMGVFVSVFVFGLAALGFRSCGDSKTPEDGVNKPGDMKCIDSEARV